MNPESLPQTDQDILNNLVQRIRDKGNLPAFNESVSDICRVTSKTDSTIPELTNIIMRDCGLTSHLLGTINSSLYGLKFPISTISGAIRMLGFERIASLATGLSIFKNSLPDIQSRDMVQLYANAYFTGSFAMGMHQNCQNTHREELFVAGLLHSFPYVVLANTFPQEYKQLDFLIKEQHLSMRQAFRKVFRIEFQQLLEAITGIYQLPEKISSLITGRPTASGYTDPIAQQAVLLADQLSSYVFQLNKAAEIQWDDLERSFMTLLKDKNFNLADYVADTCTRDGNIQKFFKVGQKDIKRMRTSLKSEPNQGIAKQLILIEKFGHEVTGDNTQETLAGFMNELKQPETEQMPLNHFLEMAQETLFRLFPKADVTLLLYNPQYKTLNGRLYMGQVKHLQPREFVFKIPPKSQSPLAKAFYEKEIKSWHGHHQELAMSPRIQGYCPYKSAHVLPLTINQKCIGAYLIASKSKELPELDHEAANTIVQEVCRAFIRSAVQKAAQ